jgi:hypothetical protein
MVPLRLHSLRSSPGYIAYPMGTIGRTGADGNANAIGIKTGNGTASGMENDRANMENMDTATRDTATRDTARDPTDVQCSSRQSYLLSA